MTNQEILDNAPEGATHYDGSVYINTRLSSYWSLYKKRWVNLDVLTLEPETRLLSDIKKNQWISVDDKLPEFFQYVLIYHPAMRCTLLGSFIKGSHKFRDVAGNSFYKDDITHWMPLPEPPKEQE